MKPSDRQRSKGAVLIIDEVLTNLEKLRARTRIMRTGGTADNIEDGNGVFDDTDFYQSLLRDIIASKTGEEDWAIEQTRKRKEKKKVVDTKASKGRKLG
jgi:protein AATF/BFR2